MREDQDFSDVTLACEGDQMIKAHKVILAASSTFFSLLLKKNHHPHPLLYMRGVSTSQLSAVIDFIYHGEVNIFQEDLDNFLKLAEELQLKGLVGSGSQNKPFQQEILQDKPISKTNYAIEDTQIKDEWVKSIPIQRWWNLKTISIYKLIMSLPTTPILFLLMHAP